MLVWILACSIGSPRPDAARTYGDALARLAGDAAHTDTICAPVTDPVLHADCVATGAERLVGSDPGLAATLCRGLAASMWRDECLFQVAENTDGVVSCDEAGRFAADCRMHRWGEVLHRGLPEDARPGRVEEHVAGMMAQAGLAPTDDDPWWAAYRAVLSRQSPLDLGSCRAVADERLAGICRGAGLQVYDDWLNYARDTTGFPCDVAPHALTGRLAYVPHPDVDALVARRKAADLCP